MPKAGWALVGVLALGVVTLPARAQTPDGLQKINHVVVVYQENWTFDGLFGKFPGANGFEGATTVRQVDKNGAPYPSLPQPMNTYDSPPRPDPRFPADLPVQPFDLAEYVQPNQSTGDLLHRFYQEQYQINGGKMDSFVAWSDAGGLVMSYYDATNMPEGKLAAQYTLLDNFFHGAFGGSFLNHQYLICVCAPSWPDAPANIVAQVDDRGMLTRDGLVTPDGYAVNTSYSVNKPHPANITDPAQLVPSQNAPTIGDRLSDKNIDWAWYAGGWNTAVLGHLDPLFQSHHQPFVYFANYAEGTPGRAQHLKDEQDLYADLAGGRLPAVAFVKPLGPDNEHPGYASLNAGQQHVADLVSAIQASPVWADTAIIITYDEYGGRWDHVPPPVIDRWGPGTRVPAIVISPFARRGFVDHTQYDTSAILKLIETRWGLEPLGSRDAAAGDLSSAFDFGQ